MSMRPHVDNASSSDDERADHPIAYFCHKLLPGKEHYSTVEKECLAIKLAVQAFCFYLLGHPSLVPRPRAPSGEKRSGERSRIPWAYYPKRVMTNEIARLVIITWHVPYNGKIC